jgi:hypothetical protein
MTAPVTRVAWMLALISLAACAGILGLRDRKTSALFPHRAHVVAGVSCTKCHPGIDRGGSELHLPTDATCTSAGCHATPHDPRPCAGCHGSQATIAELVAARENLVFDHAKHVSTTRGNCMRCHDAVSTDRGPLRPPMATCFRCHDDMQAARRCDGCHKDLAEDGTLPQSHLVHDGDWIREHAVRAASSGDLCETCHKQTFCASCHGATAPALPPERRFSDPFRANLHRAGFASRHALEARSDPGACQTCHSPDRCLMCHAQKNLAGGGGRSPHPPNWVGLAATDNLHGREARRDPASCAGCHGGAGEQLCVRCHAVGGVGGNPHPPGWSSNQPLTAMPCRMCHPLGARP